MPILAIKATIKKETFRKNYLPLFILPLLFILWRLCFLTFTHPYFFADNYEEIYRGTVAQEILLPTKLSLWDYRPDNYSGGFYVIVVLLAGLLKFLGFSMLALKSMSLVWGTLTLLTWYGILKDYVNRKAAWIFGLLFIFSPQSVTGLSSSVLGDHAETLLLSALSVRLYFQWIHSTERNTHTCVALGLLAGFSVWFAYIYGITLLSLLVFEIFYIRKLKLKTFGAAVLSFAAGFSLWLLFHWKNHFQSLVVQGAPLWESFSLKALTSPFLSWKNIFISKLFFDMPHRPFAGVFEGTIIGIYLALLGLAVVGIFTGSKESRPSVLGCAKAAPEKLFFVYLLIHFLACQFYDAVGLRYLLPAYPFLIAWLASEFSQWRGIRKSVMPMFLIGLIGCGIISTLIRFSGKYPGEFLRRKSYAYSTLAFVHGDIRPRLQLILSEPVSPLSIEDQIAAVRVLAAGVNFQNASDVKLAREIVPENLKAFFDFMLTRGTPGEEKIELWDVWERNPKEKMLIINKLKSLPPPAQEKTLRLIGYRLAEKHLESYSSPFHWQWAAWKEIAHDSPALYEGIRDFLTTYRIPFGFIPPFVGEKL